jgi:hypothetical protein
MTVKAIELMNGARRWKTSIEIPIELASDDDYIEHLKLELKERCVKEYVRNTEDSFRYSISTDRTSPIATVKMEIEDLFGLKDQNKKLHRELRELVDKYKALLNNSSAL